MVCHVRGHLAQIDRRFVVENKGMGAAQSDVQFEGSTDQLGSGAKSKGQGPRASQALPKSPRTSERPSLLH